jgi:hypothetical protein
LCPWWQRAACLHVSAAFAPLPDSQCGTFCRVRLQLKDTIAALTQRCQEMHDQVEQLTVSSSW